MFGFTNRVEKVIWPLQRDSSAKITLLIIPNIRSRCKVPCVASVCSERKAIVVSSFLAAQEWVECKILTRT